MRRRIAAGTLGRPRPTPSGCPDPDLPADRSALPDTLNRRFEALIFDWDGTAVPDRGSDAAAVREAIECASAAGIDMAVVSGTHVGNVDGQLCARPNGPGELHLLLNRGSEVFAVSDAGPRLLARREAGEAEEAALDRAAARTVELLGERGLEARIVSQRLNRRKIDVIPEPQWDDPPKARIGQLLAAVEARLSACGLDGLAGAVELAEAAARDAGLNGARVTSDAKHIEIGLTDKSDSARWFFAHAWQRGIWPEQVLMLGDELGPLGGLPGSDSKLLIEQAAGATTVSVGVEPEGLPRGVVALGGGPAQFLRLLEAQLELRRAGALPIVPSDAGWTLSVEAPDDEREAAHEALLTVADGYLGTRGSSLSRLGASRPGAVIAGLYRGEGARSELQPVPLWNRVAAASFAERAGRTLDLHTGILSHTTPAGFGALQFSSLAGPGLAVLRVRGPRGMLDAGPPLIAADQASTEPGDRGSSTSVRFSEGSLEVAAAQALDGAGDFAALERVAAYALRTEADGDRPASRALHSAREAGHERLLVEHRGAWARRWERADARIDGDEELQGAVRLALYHLMSSACDSGEAAVGARGLTGSGYGGHVFWDSDVFVLPFLAATHPASARAILEYRVRRLPAARAAARADGRRGARFAWESAAGGEDVTPRAVLDATGREVAVRTGEQEEHIVADVAWAAACYIDWTGDRAFAHGPGMELIVETARYWASRIERDGDGSGHIRGVIGPDEYHETVDDNAYTNVMARWNLRRAHAASADAEIDRDEREGWLGLADALVDGYHADSGLYEQFAGFFALEPLLIAELAQPRPVAADVLLGAERVRGAQVLKQPDALMLHHLIPTELAAGSLAPNLDFYGPRTAHGSSLSPGIHASLLARAGRLDEAVSMLKLAARIDLDDVTGSGAAGVHIAAMGGVWQALAYGFLGLRPAGGLLELDPRLPPGWEALELRVSFHGAALVVRVSAEAIELSSDRPTRVRIGGAEPVMVCSGGHRAGLAG